MILGDYGELTIIRRVYHNDNIEINLTRNGLKSKLYTTLIIKDSDLINNTIKLFSSLRDNENFKDFKECFFKNRQLYVLFEYRDEYPVKIQDLSEIPTKQKADIVKRILTQCIMLNIPLCIIYDILFKDNMNMDPSGQIYFNYFLKSIDRYNNITIKDVGKRLSTILINIFAEEIENEVCSDLKNFIYKCENGEFNEIVDIYKDYIKIYDMLMTIETIEKQSKKNILDKYKEIVKEIAGKIMPVFILAALSVGVVYAVIKLVDTMQRPNEENKIETIGTINYSK